MLDSPNPAERPPKPRTPIDKPYKAKRNPSNLHIDDPWLVTYATLIRALKRYNPVVRPIVPFMEASTLNKRQPAGAACP